MILVLQKMAAEMALTLESEQLFITCVMKASNWLDQARELVRRMDYGVDFYQLALHLQVNHFAWLHTHTHTCTYLSHTYNHSSAMHEQRRDSGGCLR